MRAAILFSMKRGLMCARGMLTGRLAGTFAERKSFVVEMAETMLSGGNPLAGVSAQMIVRRTRAVPETDQAGFRRNGVSSASSPGKQDRSSDSVRFAARMSPRPGKMSGRADQTHRLSDERRNSVMSHGLEPVVPILHHEAGRSGGSWWVEGTDERSPEDISGLLASAGAQVRPWS
jgi:hypothetical protein